MTSYRLGELSGGFGETSYDQLKTWRNVWRVGGTSYDQLYTWRNVWRVW